MRRAPAAHTLFVPRHAGYHGARSVNAARAACSASLRPHQRDGVTVAARRDAPVGVGTRNVPQDSPSPPARGEQGTMATKPASNATIGTPAQETVASRRRVTPRTNAATVAQSRVRAP